MEMLPAYMLPDKIIAVKHLLKNANGKIDRRALLESLGGTTS